MKLDEETICTSLKDLKTDEKIIIDRDEKGNITGIEKIQKSDCYVVTACYGGNSIELEHVRKSCKNLFVKNMFLFPFWFLYKYFIGEELAYLYSHGVLKKFIRVMIAEKILKYTTTKAYALQVYLIILGLFGFIVLPLFLLVKLFRIGNNVIEVQRQVKV